MKACPGRILRACPHEAESVRVRLCMKKRLAIELGAKMINAPEPNGRWRRSTGRARSVEDLRDVARIRLPRAVFDFIDGGAEDEITLKGNRDAFRTCRFLPKTLVDVSRVNMTTTLFNAPIAMPIVIGPTGAAGFAWPRGDLAMAKAAHKAGIPFTLSTSANVSLEDLAAGVPGGRWFQCYIFKTQDYTLQLIERARAFDYEALVITVDLPVGGKRERDFRNHFALPFKYTTKNVFDFMRHPSWSTTILHHGIPRLENLKGFSLAQSLADDASSVGRSYDPSFNWDGLAALREAWPRTFIVKGIVRPEDAERAARIGCDAVVVSNHGGRQLDGTAATLHALPAVAQAVGSKMTVLLDGGIRRGGDVVKALAMGAKAVLIGRAALYGLAAGGEAGVSRTLGILREELERTLQLVGVPEVQDLTPGVIFRDVQAGLTFGPER
jgi:(S)-mandelate dehydrogenase